MTRKKKKEQADIKRLIYKELISKALDEMIPKIELKLRLSKRACINEIFYRFDDFIKVFCDKNPQEAHMVKQAAILYKKDLEVLNES